MYLLFFSNKVSSNCISLPQSLVVVEAVGRGYDLLRACCVLSFLLSPRDTAPSSLTSTKGQYSSDLKHQCRVEEAPVPGMELELREKGDLGRRGAPWDLRVPG
jgi:hypothetical protein